MPAKKIYATEEELDAARKENYKRYNSSEKRKQAKLRWKEKNKNNKELKARYCEKQREWFNSLSEEDRAEFKNKAKIAAKARHAKDPRQRMLASARKRAKEKCIDFDLVKDDIVVPSICPVLGIPIFVSDNGKSPNSPSLDRIDNSKGYIKTNVAVISLRANALKNDADVEELKLIVKYMEVHTCLGTE